MKIKVTNFLLLIPITVVLGLVACSSQNLDRENDLSSGQGRIKVVATTTIVGDVVAQIGGDLIDLSVLLPIGADPHSFNPTPQDIAKVADADLVFANGLGLEEFLNPLIQSAGAEDIVVSVSEGIDPLVFAGEADHEDEDEGQEHQGFDPHTWTNPKNVIIWVQNIEKALRVADSQNGSAFAQNAQAYETELIHLDSWMRDQIDQVPLANRKLVTDHTLFSYFAAEYGFEQVGALIPGYSTLAEPTAQELAKIEDAIRQLDVRAVFVGNTVNPALAERVTADTGTVLVLVYTGSLSQPDGDASSYLKYMRYNTNAFVNALK